MAQKIEVREEEVLSVIKKLRYAQEDIAEAYPEPAPTLSCAAEPTATQELDDMLDWAMVELKNQTTIWQQYLAVQADSIKATVQDVTALDEGFAQDLNVETGWVAEVAASSPGEPAAVPPGGPTIAPPAPTGSGRSGGPGAAPNGSGRSTSGSDSDTGEGDNG